MCKYYHLKFQKNSPFIKAIQTHFPVTIILLALLFTFNMSHAQEWNFPDKLDALTAAPESHHLIFENEYVRVMKVTLQPGEREPLHTHKNKSVMYIEQPAWIKSYDENGKVLFELPKGVDASQALPPMWLEPEGPHAVENHDKIPFSALRVEVKTKDSL